MIEHEGKLLLIKEAKPEVYGRWNTPAGHLEDLETPIACALREAKEESGYDVELTGVQSVYHIAQVNYVVDYCFLARPKNMVQAPLADDVLEARWFSREEIAQISESAWRSPRSVNRVKDWLEGKKFPIEMVAEHPLPKNT